jgi:hypothetical protein
MCTDDYIFNEDQDYNLFEGDITNSKKVSGRLRLYSSVQIQTTKRNIVCVFSCH